MTKQELIDFETHIANQFNEGKIRAPVHLYYGNEKNIISVFSTIKKKIGFFVVGDHTINVC